MKKFIFKTVSLIIIFTYIFNLCLHDLSFAETTENSSSSITTNTTSSVTKEELMGYEPGDFAPSQGAQIAPLSSTPSSTPLPDKVISNFYLNPYSGSPSISLPLFIPPGRNGLKPNLTLTYSPSYSNGLLGVGWFLNFGFIERSTKKGVPKYDSTDTFVYSLSGGASEIVLIGNNEYRSKIESEFLNFKMEGDSWKVKDKKGNTYYFGRDSSTKLSGLNNSTFRWYLDGIKDENGNSLIIGYNQAIPTFIKYIGYQPNSDSYDPTLSYIFSINIIPESAQRGDSFKSYRSGVGSSLEGIYRIKEIEIKDDLTSKLIRKYSFEYQYYSRRTNRSLLTKVIEYGSDGLTSNPPITFTYQDTNQPAYNISSITDPTQGDNLWNVNWSTQTCHHYLMPFSARITPTIIFKPVIDDRFHTWTYAYVRSSKAFTISVPSGRGYPAPIIPTYYYLNGNKVGEGSSVTLNLQAGYNLIEVNGCQQDYDLSNATQTIISNVDLMNSSQVILPQLSGDFNADGLADVGTFFSSSGKIMVALSNGSTFLPKQTWIQNFGTNQKLLLGDFNADAKTDICAFDSASGSWRIALSDGTKFVDDGVWSSSFGANQQPLTGDFNGDGLTDICAAVKQTGYLRVDIALNSGKGFTVSSYSPSLGKDSDIPFLGDFNGDGLTDICSFNYDTGDWTIRINDGALSNFTSFANIYNFGAKKNAVISDFNSDGLTDIGYYDYSTGNITVKLLKAWDSFANSQTLPIQFNLKDSTVQIQTGDYNADGLIDFCAYSPSGHLEVALSQGEIPDLLSKVENGIGASLELKYNPSSQFDNKGGDPEVDLPLVIPVLTESIISDGQGNSYKTTYSYSGGLYDIQDRELRGFAYAKITDPEGNYTESYFNQDDIFKGRPSKQEVKDKSGNLYTKTENTWQYTQPYTGAVVYFPYLAKTDNYTYNGDTTYKQTQIKLEYDSYGNPTKVISEGEAGLTGDEKTQVTEYVYNTTDWLLSFPKHTYLLDQNQNKVQEAWFYYDNATSIDTSPTKGLLTKEETWLYNPLTQSTQRITQSYSYDPYGYGNLTKTTDALGRDTTTEYDSLTQSYPVKVTNVLGHSVQTVYYGINDPITDTIKSSGLLGQVKSIEDPNKQKTYNIYDNVGRIIKVIGPLDTETNPGIIYEYDLTTKPIKITKKVKADYSSTPQYLTIYQFFDGLGRLIQTKSPAEDDPMTLQKRQIISDITKFDSRGQIKEGYLPYFANESSNYETPIYTQSKTSFTYDALGRLTQTTNLDTTYSQIIYDDWIVTSIDEEFHVKKSYLDAYGKIVKVEEYQGEYPSHILYATTTYAYDTLGNLSKVTDNQNNITQIWYDSLGRKIKMDDPDMGIWTYEYDNVGNLKKQTDAKGQILEFKYDDINSLTDKLVNGQTLVSYKYDTGTYGIGRLTKVTDLSGSTEFFYDSLGRETKSIKTVDGSGYTVERTYDALDRLTSLKYPDGESVNYTYNPQGIEKVEGFTTQGTVTYVKNIDYSATGQIIKIQYGNGTETNYTYDQNTLRLTNLATQSGSTKLQDLEYKFYNGGNIKTITDYANTNTSSQSFLYDDLDRLIQAQGSYGTYTYSYDSIGNMTSKEGVTLTYGKNGKLPHAVIQYGSTVIDYDANGNMNKKGNSTYAYDVENRLIKVEEKKEDDGEATQTLNITLTPGWNFFSIPFILSDYKIGSALSSISGKYSQVSRYNDTTKQFEHYVGNSKYDQFTSFEYGKGYQIYIIGSSNLTLTISGTLPTTTQNLSLKSGYNFIFCPKDSETSVETAFSPLKLDVDYSKVYHYNKTTALFEKYDSSTKEFTTLKPGESYYIYCLKDTTWNISPDHSITTTTFSYDGDGGRVKKTVGSSTTTYIGSLYELESDGTVRKHIFSGSNRVCTVNSKQSTVNYMYYHSDHLGSSNVITDSSGNKLAYYEYTPYGGFSPSQTSSASQTNVTYFYTGKELDSSTNLYFYGARYYDPELGRFISADTIVQAPYYPQSLNRYTYCLNNPINLIDPTGEFAWIPFFIALAKIAAVVSVVATIASIASALAGNQQLASIFSRIGMISGAVSFVAGMSALVASSITASNVANSIGASIASPFAEGGSVELGTIIVNKSAEIVAQEVAWQVSKEAVKAGIVGAVSSVVSATVSALAATASSAVSSLATTASFIIDTATISSGVELIRGANYGTLRGWLESGVGLIGVAAVTADTGLSVATLGAKGIVQQQGRRIVIGEGSERVAKKALEIGAERYIPRKAVSEIGLKRAMKNNYQWLRNKVKQGYKIIDIGLDPNPERTARGIFYEAEKRWLKIWGK